jgi:hypothetical protein
MPGVEEMTVRLGRSTRRRISWGLGGFTVVWGGLWIAAMVFGRHATLVDNLIVSLIFLVVWLPVPLIFLLRVAGRTRVGPAGLRWWGVLAGGFIPWDDVVEIKDRFHPGRGNGWWTVEAKLATGSVRRLPGFYCEGPPPGEYAPPKRDGAFDTQLTEVRDRLRQWQRA